MPAWPNPVPARLAVTSLNPRGHLRLAVLTWSGPDGVVVAGASPTCVTTGVAHRALGRTQLERVGLASRLIPARRATLIRLLSTADSVGGRLACSAGRRRELDRAASSRRASPASVLLVRHDPAALRRHGARGRTALLGCAEFPVRWTASAALCVDGRASAPAGGVHAIGISDLAITRDAIWFAGSIAEAGSGDTLVPTVSVARYVLPAP